jgi:hypothetical protein
MPGAREEYERLGWLLREGKVSPNEKCKLILPRLDAKAKIENREKRKRWSVVVSENEYSELAAYNEAYMLTCHQNPSLRTAAILEALKSFNVKGWLEEQEPYGS